MDTLKICKNWEDENLIELRVEASNDYVHIWQTCYTARKSLNDFCSMLNGFLYGNKSGFYHEFGEKSGDYTPAFSMDISRTDKSGHIKIDLDMENEDDETRKHRCGLYVHTEEGKLFEFNNEFKALIDNKSENAVLNRM